jgi:hypothetical protein
VFDLIRSFPILEFHPRVRGSEREHCCIIAECEQEYRQVLAAVDTNMESFKQRYEERCQQFQIEPLDGLLNQLSSKKLLDTQNDRPQTAPQAGLDKIAADLDTGKVTFGNHGGNGTNNKSAHPEELDLSGQTLSLKMCKSLAEALQTDNVFRRLNFSDTLMGDDGCVVVANALKTNAVVQVLDLRGNNIRSDGAVGLAQMLKVNGSLKRWAGIVDNYETYHGRTS